MAKYFSLELDRVVHLYYEEQLSLEKISRQLNCSTKKVKTTLLKAGYKLRTSTEYKKIVEIASASSKQEQIQAFEEIKDSLDITQQSMFIGLAKHDLESAKRYAKMVSAANVNPSTNQKLRKKGGKIST